MRLLAVALVLIASASSANAGKVVINTFGCIIKEDLARATLDLQDEDRQALAQALLARGLCRLFEKGDRVLVEKREKPLRCIVPRGDVRCYWVFESHAAP